jgi:hypothetical protein
VKNHLIRYKSNLPTIERTYEPQATQRTPLRMIYEIEFF